MKLSRPDSRTSLLLYGDDEALVRTRGWVLEQAGFRTKTVLSVSAILEIGLREKIDLFLLCDSLSLEARTQALAVIHANWPQARRLVLATAADSPEIPSAEVVVPSEEGPRKLLAVIHEQMAILPTSL